MIFNMNEEWKIKNLLMYGDSGWTSCRVIVDDIAVYVARWICDDSKKVK